MEKLQEIRRLRLEIVRRYKKMKALPIEIARLAHDLWKLSKQEKLRGTRGFCRKLGLSPLQYYKYIRIGYDLDRLNITDLEARSFSRIGLMQIENSLADAKTKADAFAKIKQQED